MLEATIFAYLFLITSLMPAESYADPLDIVAWSGLQSNSTVHLFCGEADSTPGTWQSMQGEKLWPIGWFGQLFDGCISFTRLANASLFTSLAANCSDRNLALHCSHSHGAVLHSLQLQSDTRCPPGSRREPFYGLCLQCPKGKRQLLWESVSCDVYEDKYQQPLISELHQYETPSNVICEIGFSPLISFSCINGMRQPMRSELACIIVNAFTSSTIIIMMLFIAYSLWQQYSTRALPVVQLHAYNRTLALLASVRVHCRLALTLGDFRKLQEEDNRRKEALSADSNVEGKQAYRNTVQHLLFWDQK